MPVLNSLSPVPILSWSATLSLSFSPASRISLPFFRPHPGLNPRCAHFPPISHHRANSSRQPCFLAAPSTSLLFSSLPAASLQLCTAGALLSIPRRKICNCRDSKPVSEHFRPVMLPIRPKPCESPAFSTRAQIFKDPIFPMYPLSLLARIFTILLFPLQFQKSDATQTRTRAGQRLAIVLTARPSDWPHCSTFRPLDLRTLPFP